MAESHEEVLAAYAEAAGLDTAPDLPPAAEALGIKFTDYEPKKHLFAVFPAEPRWAGFGGAIEPGCIAMASCLTAGMLAELLAKKPCLQLTSDAMSVKSLTADGRWILLEARLKATRGSVIFCEVTIKDADAKLAGRVTCEFAARKTSKSAKANAAEDAES